MKKQIFSLIAASIIIGVAIVSVISCSKNDNSLTTEKNYHLKEFIPEQKDVVLFINSFNTKYVEYNLGYKSGEDIPLNEALWNLEAGVNYEFRYPKDSLTIVSYSTTSFIIGVTKNASGELIVNNDDLYSSYADILLFSENAINSNGTTSKLVFADLEIESIDENEAELVITAGIGQPKPRVCYVQSDDYWYAADELGYCTGGQAQTGILDAADRIDELLENRHCSYPICPGGGEINFYTSITEKSFYWNSAASDWYFWSGNSSSSNDCFDPDDISYWWGVAENLIEDERPTGKSFMDVVFKDEFALSSSEWIHCIDPVRYGIPDCTGSGGGM